MKKIVITGGHLTPAQAVIEELKKRGKWEIFYLGRKYSLEGQKIPSIESEVIPKLGVKFIPVPAGRFQRRFSSHTLLSLLRIPFAFVYSLSLLVRIRPQIILSFGGYVSVPMVIAGWFLRIPILTHEQTVVLGLANQINARFAKKILVSFPESLNHFPREKVVLTGNPIRKEILKYQVSSIKYKQSLISGEIQVSQENLPLVYITGGNQGARVINRAVVEVLPELLKKYRIIHQCGKLDYNKLKAQSSRRRPPVGGLWRRTAKLKARFEKRYFLTDYVGPKDIGWVLNEADLVVSRAGANIVTELAALGKPAIFIPIPWARKDEQTKNAQILCKAGTAVILPQSELSGRRLKTTIEKIMANLGEYRAAALRAKKLVKLSAAKEIIKQIEDVCKG